MTKESIRIGTRGSKLALWQAHHVQSQLADHQVDAEIIIIKTKGDQIQHLSFDKLEGKGFFTKEIEEALKNDLIDVAVHSLKDLPTEMDPALCISGLSYRETPNDALIIDKDKVNPEGILNLPKSPLIGTSSIRRKSMIADLIPDVRFKDIRGNVPTRIKKLKDENLDAIVLAEAGLNRLESDLSAYKKVRLHHSEVVPAAGQGVIAYQTRVSDIKSRRIIQKIHHKEVAACTNVERTVLKHMDGGCQVPLGVYCEYKHDKYSAFAAHYIDKKMKRARLSQSTHKGLAEEIIRLLKK